MEQLNKDYNYIIKTEVIGNGSVSVSKEIAKEGEIIEVTCSAASGYVLESVTVHGEKIEAPQRGAFCFYDKWREPLRATRKRISTKMGGIRIWFIYFYSFFL